MRGAKLLRSGWTSARSKMLRSLAKIIARRLELRRRGVAADGVEALDVHLRQAADERGIVRDACQADRRGAVDAGVRRCREVVAARRAEADFTDQRRRDRPRCTERKTLR